MRTAVIVHETRADFEAWLKSAGGPVDPSRLFAAHCGACHTLDGTPSVGPSLKGYYGSKRTVLDTSTNSTIEVTADDAYTVESIKNPNAKLSRAGGKEFAKDQMPSDFGTKLKEEEIELLIELLKERK